MKIPFKFRHPWQWWLDKRSEEEETAKYNYRARYTTIVAFLPFKFTGPVYSNGLFVNWNWINPNGTVTTIGPKDEDE